MNRLIITIKNSECINLKERIAYRSIWERKLPSFKNGGSWWFRKEDIYDWTNVQTEGINNDKIRRIAQ